MSSAAFGWESLLSTDAPDECSLKAALFTTYDRADERLLAEHLLPLLLKLSREPEGEGAERQYFLLELDRRLKQLHDRLVVVSSTARAEPGEPGQGESGTYGWIWRSIRPLTVGSRRNAVQHAKLWLFHWGAEDEAGAEYLEIVVSSTNLTRAAFKDQIQAAWRACIELGPLRSESRLRGWGILPAFLRELAASAGDDSRLALFLELLARADCPEGVAFVASIPGTHSRQALRRTPWGAAGLKESMPSGRGAVTMSILSPFVGSWSSDALNRWCVRFESSPHRLKLVWIDKNHPWARAGRWILPKSTLDTLTRAGATLLRLRHEPDDYENTGFFHEERLPSDDRWNHAKVYSLKRGNSRRLLITSANFSTAAWGRESRDGELTIENFELGVCVEQGRWPFEHLDIFEDEESAATVSKLPSHGGNLIAWARAVWNGKKINVECRCEANRDLKGEVNSGGERTPIANWATSAAGRLRTARVPWADTKQPPSFVQLTCERETVNVAVFDERPSKEREDTVPPEVDENIGQTMRDELLFEQYGARVADDIEDQESTNDEHEPDGPLSGNAEIQDPGDGSEEEVDEAGTGHSDSYAVPASDLARQHLLVVDNWARLVMGATKRGTQEFERQVLRRDGELLKEAFQRQEVRDGKKDRTRAVGAKLAVEELTLRLKQFPEARCCRSSR